MSKPENLGLIVFLGILVGMLCTLIFWMVLKFFMQDAQFKHNRREANKAAIILREERQKMERLLKTVNTTEKDKE